MADNIGHHLKLLRSPRLLLIVFAIFALIAVLLGGIAKWWMASVKALPESLVVTCGIQSVDTNGMSLVLDVPQSLLILDDRTRLPVTIDVKTVEPLHVEANHKGAGRAAATVVVRDIDGNLSASGHIGDTAISGTCTLS